MIKSMVCIKTDFCAIHNWPDCDIDEVDFLKYPHRHKIYVKVKIETESDRQIEFFMLKNKIDEIIDKIYGKEKIKKIKSRSMETICRELICHLLDDSLINGRDIIVEAWEDNEVGAVMELKSEKC